LGYSRKEHTPILKSNTDSGPRLGQSLNSFLGLVAHQSPLKLTRSFTIFLTISHNLAFYLTLSRVIV